MDTVAINSALLGKLRKHDHAGYDPFDYLNSKIFSATPLYRSEFMRLAWIQLGKRLPVNFRPVFRVPRMRNPKGVGLTILGLLEDYHRTGQADYLNEALQLGEWLLTERSDVTVWKHSCWGYHFDWQARAFFVPKGKPNIISTVYVARALLALSEFSPNKGFRDAALDSACFIQSSLYSEDDQGGFYAYIPGETAFVHNASLWGAAWCIQVANLSSDTEMFEQAHAVMMRSVDAQREDGAWVYGDRHHHQFVDGFHTGYNLEALNMVRAVTGSTEFDQVIDRGYKYYKENFFLEDGTACYYNNSVYPIDFHSVSQAILTLITLGGRHDLALCEKVISKAIEQLYLPEHGRFAYQKHHFFTNKVDYLRWTQAWAYYSLSVYNRFINECTSHEKD
ncbi:MAG: aspartate-semialdehyde dehydrogenase [Marinobacterium sp.]|nr:aspartate-semialdehyde dehydrogenase [Marinobacterium sp.]